ncbi:hypothetical protein TRFO_05212 [Tritrichomonas foetus]|uniref:DUF3447 domain-containing protein n=1 Tax=Tritrichomonas foetus TaxID=1144522 RepID=A0A1J4K837_9EUKA|nr:hypothetical protein TRFO_05212 [Tritrichomonas foetus]|eukprot:OHT07567.1 hypothetical protein TRFO_05212 [Tritrichomonas foetus]
MIYGHFSEIKPNNHRKSNSRLLMKKKGGKKKDAYQITPDDLFYTRELNNDEIIFKISPSNYLIPSHNNFSPSLDFTIISGDIEYKTSLEFANTIPEIKKQLKKDPWLRRHKLKNPIDLSPIIDLLELTPIPITLDNYESIISCFNSLKIKNVHNFIMSNVNSMNCTIQIFQEFNNEILLNCDILSEILDLSEDNFNETLLDVVSSDLFKTPEVIANFITTAVRIRPENCKALAKFCIEIMKKLDFWFLHIVIQNCDQKDTYFLLKLFQADQSDPYKEQFFKTLKYESQNIFTWFSPEFEKFDNQKYYEQLKKYQLQFSQVKRGKERSLPNEKDIPESFQFFISNISKFYKNDWELHREITNCGRSQNKLASMIRNDDINDFQQEIFSASMTQQIPYSIFERSNFLNKSPYLIEYAAYFGSMKIFKFLLLNTNKLFNSLKFAIIGNNIEIVRICHQNNCDLIKGLKTSIKYHRYEIFDWIFSQIKCEHQEYKACIKYNNLYALRVFVGKGIILQESCYELASCNCCLVLLKILHAFGLVPNEIIDCIIQSIKKGYHQTVEFFLQNFPKQCSQYNLSSLLYIPIEMNFPQVLKVMIDSGMFYININVPHLDDDTPLIIAVKKESLEMVEMILNEKNIDVNEVNGNNLTALMIACEKGNEKIVKRLVEVPDIDLFLKKDSLTAAKIASNHGFFKIYSFLMEKMKKIQK